MNRFKRFIFALAMVVSFSNVALAQGKVAYIYSEKVFKSMPSYNSAVKELESYGEVVSKRSNAMLAHVQELYSEYRIRGGQMSSSAKERLRKEIIEKEQEANEYEEKSMVAKQKELMAPLERKVQLCLDRLAREGGYDMIFDLSVANIAIYKKPSLDLTDLVISNIK